MQMTLENKKQLNGDTRFIGQRLQYIFYNITNTGPLLSLQIIQHVRALKFYVKRYPTIYLYESL